MSTSCAFCGMAARDGEPCCTSEYRRETMRRADRDIRALRAENERLAAWKAEHQSVLVAASARLVDTGSAKGPGILDAIEAVCASHTALRAQGIEVEEDEARSAPTYRFSVDGKMYAHPSSRISVQQILMYACLTGDSSASPPIGPHTLYRVIDGWPDQQIRSDERIDLTPAQVAKFISVPPGIMGG